MLLLIGYILICTGVVGLVSGLFIHFRILRKKTIFGSSEAGLQYMGVGSFSLGLLIITKDFISFSMTIMLAVISIFFVIGLFVDKKAS